VVSFTPRQLYSSYFITYVIDKHVEKQRPQNGFLRNPESISKGDERHPETGVWN
jgi:hypothetical protein